MCDKIYYDISFLVKPQTSQHKSVWQAATTFQYKLHRSVLQSNTFEKDHVNDKIECNAKNETHLVK